MNLYDLVLRKDRAIDIAGSVESCTVKRPTGSMRALRFAPGSNLCVRSAHEAQCLSDFPGNPGWQATGNSEWSAVVEIKSPNWSAILAEAHGDASVEVDLSLGWPVPVPSHFDLFVRAAPTRPLLLLVGPLFNPRTAILPLLRGRGVEVGPGLNPVVQPRHDVDVRYVEKKHPREWATTYAKRELTKVETALWDRYIVDSARYLMGFEDGSLDFIFSNHVLEHLVDPIGTLTRWWDRLAPGGVLAGVVPDARFTFDWRQPTWSIDDVRAQRGMETDVPTQEMYERWCCYTSPENTPQSLRARDYSIHVNYLTPTLMRQVLDEVVREIEQRGRSAPDGVFLQSVANGKDFSFLMRKTV
jgi:SAM-dependent methyltransferase